MKIAPVNYTHGGLALEIIAETPVETALLQDIFTHGEMRRGNGESITASGLSTGFYLGMKPRAGLPSRSEAKAGGNDDGE